MTSTNHKQLHVTKASGNQMIFMAGKLKYSLKRSGADEASSKKIVLSNQLLKESHLLKILRIDDSRSKQIMIEIEGLCTPMIKAT
jgi:hypothetical protein